MGKPLKSERKQADRAVELLLEHVDVRVAYRMMQRMREEKLSAVDLGQVMSALELHLISTGH